MKKYVILFLMMLSLQSYAPNIQTNNKLTNVEVTVRNNQKIEKERDVNDTILLTKLKMLHQFSYENRVKTRAIADSLRIKTCWLYQIIYIESRGNTKAINPLSGASGLIGFLPSTAAKLGSDIHSVRSMSTSNQLDLVNKYLKLAAGGKQLKSLLDVYLAIFSPRSIQMKESYVIGNKTSRVYNQNKTLDVNRDSTITIKDVKIYIHKIFI
jgi:hypothetical protein